MTMTKEYTIERHETDAQRVKVVARYGGSTATVTISPVKDGWELSTDERVQTLADALIIARKRVEFTMAVCDGGRIQIDEIMRGDESIPFALLDARLEAAEAE